MNIKDQIRAEIEKRRDAAKYYDMSGGDAPIYDDLLAFLDTLPEQPMEGLEEEYKDYVDNDPVYSKLVNRNAGLGIARHFAEWGAEHLRDTTKMIPEGLEEAAGAYLDNHKPLTRYNWGDLMDAFKAGAEWMKSKMPKWHKVEKDGMLDKPTQFILAAKEGYFFCTGDYISRDGYAIFVDELEKLPKGDEK